MAVTVVVLACPAHMRMRAMLKMAPPTTASATTSISSAPRRRQVADERRGNRYVACMAFRYAVRAQ